MDIEPRQPSPAAPADGLDDRLDEALEQSFPASDPPAVSRRERPV